MHADRLPRRSGFRRIQIIGFVIVLMVGLAACDNEGSSSHPVAFAPTASSTLPPITASINPGIGIGGFACPGGPIASTFQIVISASQTVDLDQVSIQLIDGSHLGGPMVTFPSPLLTSQFSSRRILAGTTRAFTFRPQFVCGAARPHAVSAQIAYLSLMGVMQGITIEQPL